MSRSTMAKQGLLPRKLLQWYDAHARELPWRSKPGVRADPYHVWLSEIMLQQTTVAAVKAYFEKFLVLWPRVEDLAAASLDDVLRAWAGLGYYARARNLHACATQVAGRFPDTIEGLRALPGIGPYTAGAIAAIAYDQPHAAVDGNVERVISRLHAIEAPLPESKPLIRELAQALVPLKRAGDFAQGMMDLGATICTPRSPACGYCPWTDHCAARKRGLAEILPRKAAKKPVPTRYGTAFWMTREDGAVLLRRRPEKGLLGGMMEVPSTVWSETKAKKFEAPLDADWEKLRGKVEHTFTHFHLELEVLRGAGVRNGEVMDGCRWVAVADLAGEALPTLMRKVVALALDV